MTNAPPADHPRRRRYPIEAALGWLAVALFAAALVVSLVPVSTPQVQDCGPPLTFALRGEVDRYPDGENRIQRDDGSIATLDPAVADAARARPCGDRVGTRMAVAGLLALVASLIGLCLVVEVVVRMWREAGPRHPRPADPAGPHEPVRPAVLVDASAPAGDPAATD